MTSFNLVNDPWLPVGGTTVSIRDALAKAHELPGWLDGDFGLVETALRLLVPIAYRLTGLDDTALSDSPGLFAEWQRACFEKGHFDEDAVDDYVNRHVDRFWMLGGPVGCVPFAQDPALGKVSPHEAAKAVTAWASGNNPVLGPHTDTDELPPDLAAQRLLVLRSYAWGGTHTDHPDWKGQGKFVGGRLRGTMSVHPIGDTLASTLIGHLVPLPGGETEFGSPFWELPIPQNPVAAHEGRSGMLEQIAGRQDKTMLLRVDEKKIKGFTIAEGPGVDHSLFCDDPYLLLDPDGEPRKPRAQKAFWRESEALLTEAESKPGRRELQARILDWASGEHCDLYIEEQFSWAVVSHLGNKSKDLMWSRSLAPHLLRLFDPASSQRAWDFLQAANQAESLMAKQLAKVWHATDQMPDKPADRAAVYRPARAEFWKRAEQDFWVTVNGVLSPQEIKDRLRFHALVGFDWATDRMARDQRALLAMVESRQWIERWERLNQARPQNKPPDGLEKTT